jgi:predicted Zn-dependent peptidase
VRAISLADISGFYGECYCPDNALSGVQGDIDPERVFAIAARAFGAWKKSTLKIETPMHRFRPTYGETVHLVDWPNEPKSYIAIYALGARRTDPDYPAFVVANKALGAGSSGLLMSYLREERELTYGSFSRISTVAGQSIFRAGVTVASPNAPEAVARLIACIHALQRTPLSAHDLATAKNGLMGDQLLLWETNGSAATSAMDAMANGESSDSDFAQTRRIAAVTAKEVQTAANRYLADDSLQIIVIGPEAQFGHSLTAFGPVLHYNRFGVRDKRPADMP